MKGDAIRIMLAKATNNLFVFLLGGIGAFLVVSFFGLALPLVALIFVPTAFFLSFLVAPPRRTVLGKLALLLSIITIVLGLFAPCRAVMSFIIPSLEADRSSVIVKVVTLPGSWFEIMTGIAGVLFGLGYLSDAVWRMRTARQVRNLATASAASAAPGLSEFRGTVRMRESLAGANAPVPPGTVLFYPEAEMDTEGTDLLAEWDRRPVVRPFYLEDRSGRILVDPSQAVMHQSLFHRLLGNRACEIVLTRHRRQEKREVSGGRSIEFIERWLEDGDPLYLIGQVTVNNDAGVAPVDRLVVRVSPEAKIADSLLNRVGFGFNDRARRDIHDVFFLSDRDETSAGPLIMRVAWMRLLLSLLWVLLSALLIVRADLVR